jgi:hypothetical protein
MRREIPDLVRIIAVQPGQLCQGVTVVTNGDPVRGPQRDPFGGEDVED